MPTNFTRNYPSRCVTARITRAGQLYSEHFPLTRFRSWEHAEKAARSWLRKIRPQLPDATPSKGRVTQRNASGVVGVQLRASGRPEGAVQYSWQSFWPGRPGGSSWAVAKYGDRIAFVCAVLARRMETTDRDAIEAEFKRIKGSADYRAILRRKRQSAP